MGKRRPSRPWREVEGHALGREAGRVYSEHVMVIWRLYAIENLSMTDIAAIYGAALPSIYRIITKVRRYMIGKGDEADARYCQQAEAYGEALRILSEKRRMHYETIARETGLPVRKIRQIAKRNRLER